MQRSRSQREEQVGPPTTQEERKDKQQPHPSPTDPREWPWRKHTTSQVMVTAAIQKRHEQGSEEVDVQIEMRVQQWYESRTREEHPFRLSSRESPEKWPWRRNRSQRSVSESENWKESVTQKDVPWSVSFENIEGRQLPLSEVPVSGNIPQQQISLQLPTENIGVVPRFPTEYQIQMKLPTAQNVGEMHENFPPIQANPHVFPAVNTDGLPVNMPQREIPEMVPAPMETRNWS